MVSDLTIVILALSAGIAGGFWTPILAWLSSTEAFNVKKFMQGLMTCIGAGLGCGIVALQAPPTDGAIALTIFWFFIFFASSGIDYTRNKVGSMTRTTQTEVIKNE